MAFLAGVISLFIPKSYRAEAVLLINPSPYKSSSLEQPPLDVDIYEKMLRAPALVEEVKRKAGLGDITVEKLRNQMNVALTRRPSQRETTYAPMLLLQVEDRSPELCERIANLWADLATSASWRVKSAVLEAVNERIRKQFADTTRTLAVKEDALKVFDTTAQLIERKAELEMIRMQLASEQDNLESLRLQHAAAQTRVEDLKRKYASFFVNGVWLGTLNGSGTTGPAVSIPLDTTEPLPRQFLLARNDLAAKTQAYTDYKTRQKVDVTRRQYDILINKIIRFEQDIEEMKLSLATYKAKLADLETTSKSVPERLVVRKAITDDALWAAKAASPESLDRLAKQSLAAEEINPLWLSLHGRIQYFKPEIASLEARIQAYENLLRQLREEQDQLDEVVVKQTQTAQNLSTEVQMARDRYDALFQIFLGISQDIMRQESEVSRLREEIANSQKQVDRLTSAALALTAYTVAKDLERERLQRDLLSVKNIYATLATRYEEARVTELEVSGDLYLAFRAVRPESKIKPKRTLIVGVAWVCALALFGLLAVAREHVRQQVRA